MEHIPSALGWGLAAVVAIIFYLHFTDGDSSNQRVSPRQSDVARLQLVNQTATVQAKRDAIKARKAH